MEATLAGVVGIIGFLISLYGASTIIDNYSVTGLGKPNPGNLPTNLTTALGSLQESIEASLNSTRSLQTLIKAKEVLSLDDEAWATFTKTVVQLEEVCRAYRLRNTEKFMSSLGRHLLEIFTNPSPPIFLFACLIYFGYLMFLREIQKNDRHQDKFILGGVAMGIAAAVYEKEWWRLKGYVAWCALAGLMLSATLHLAISVGRRVIEKPILERLDSEADLEIEEEGRVVKDFARASQMRE